MNGCYIMRENLMCALAEAIRGRGDWEKEQSGPTFESALVAGWKEVLEKMQSGHTPEIRQ